MKEQTTQWEEWKKTMTGTDKKVWIVTAAVLLVLILAALTVAYGIGTKKQGQDELCPYQWEQKSSGELAVTIDVSAVKKVDFAAVTAEDTGEIIQCEIRRTGNKVRCTFRGTEMGVTQIVLQGQRTEPVPETVCQIRLVLSVQEDLSVDVLETEETENVTFQKVEAQNAFPCYYLPYTQDAGTPLEIRVQQTEDENWMFVTEGDVMAVSAMRYEGTCYLGILSGAASAATADTTGAATEISEAGAMLYNAAEDIQYTFVLSVMSDGTLAVKSAAAGNCELTQEGDSFRTLDMPEEDSNQ